MLRVDERRHAAKLLRFRNDLQRQRRLARRLGAEDLDDAAARHAADAERVIDADGAGRNRVDRLDGALLAQAHDRALAELLLDLADGQFDGLEAFLVLAVVAFVLVHWRHAAPHNLASHQTGRPLVRHSGRLLLNWKPRHARTGAWAFSCPVIARAGSVDEAEPF